MDTVEPIYHALETLNMQLLFDTLGIKRYPITKNRRKRSGKFFKRNYEKQERKEQLMLLRL